MPSSSRRVGAMIALVAGGVVAGGVLASSVAANAEGKAPAGYGYGFGDRGPGGPGFGGRGDHGTPLSADALAKVKAAIAAKYPGATVDGAHAEDDGYDALITKKDGTHARVELDKAFAVTGEDTRGPGGPKGTPLSADALAKVKAAIAAKYPGATVDGAHAEDDGYDALITKKDGTHARVELDKAFAVTGEDTAGPGRPGGPRGDRPAPLAGDALAKVKAAIAAKYPGATVELATQDRDGSGYDAFVTKKDGTHVRVELDAAFAVTGEDTARFGGHGPHGGPPPGSAPTQNG